MSNKISCRDTFRAKIYQTEISLFTVETLHPYWYLKNRLLFDSVVDNDTFDSFAVRKNPTENKISISDNQTLVLPTNRRVRFSNLQSLFNDVS